MFVVYFRPRKARWEADCCCCEKWARSSEVQERLDRRMTIEFLLLK